MIDTYLKSTDKASLALALLTFEKGFPELRHKNVIGIMQGVPAMAEVLEKVVDGELLEAQEAQPVKGDPNAFYICIRHEGEIELPEKCEIASPEEAIPVCGVWA